MKKVFVLAAFFFASTSMASVPFLNGDYQCEDGGILSLQWSKKSNWYDASLDYANGNSSALNRIVLNRGKAIILTDDGDDIGVVISGGAAGTRLTLQFNSGDKLFCRHTTLASIVEE